MFSAGLIGSLAPTMVAVAVVPQFKDLFASFGATQLPLATRLLLQFGMLSWLLPLIVLAAGLYWPDPRRRTTIAFAIGMACLVVLVPLMVIALYLPVFELARSA